MLSTALQNNKLINGKEFKKKRIFDFLTLGIMMGMGSLSTWLIMLNIEIYTSISIPFALMRRMSHLWPLLLV